MNQKALENKARKIRENILSMVYNGKSSHVGTALSSVEILTVLYFEILNIFPKDPNNAQRDRFILSKGHGCTALYSTLAERGFFKKKILQGYYTNGGQLPGHATYQCVQGVEASTGSLGHGLGIGIGMAYGAKISGESYRTYVLLGDGECNEGSVWEAALAASQWNLDNLIAIVDHNHLQGCGTTEQIMNLHPFAKKWKSFGWEVKQIDGHNMKELKKTFQYLPFKKGKPNVVIANTTKGKGVSYMEHQLDWHYRSPNSELYEKALKEINKRNYA